MIVSAVRRKHPDIRISGVAEPVTGLGRQLRVDLDRGHVPAHPGDFGQQRRVVPGAGTDLPHLVSGLDVHLAQHRRDHRGHGRRTCRAAPHRRPGGGPVVELRHHHLIAVDGHLPALLLNRPINRQVRAVVLFPAPDPVRDEPGAVDGAEGALEPGRQRSGLAQLERERVAHYVLSSYLSGSMSLSVLPVCLSSSTLCLSSLTERFLPV